MGLENLKKLRKEMKMTQGELAAILGIDTSSISKYERSDIVPSHEVLQNMADYFDVSVDYILGRTSEKTHDSNATWIPVLGRIPAGTPIEAIEDIVDREDIPSALARKGDYFGLRVVGSSMSPNYLDGDTIIVRKQEDCESGDDCVVMVNGDDATFKRVIKSETGIVLRPLNPDYDMYMYSNEDIEKLPVKIVGVAVEVRRKIGNR